MDRILEMVDAVSCKRDLGMLSTSLRQGIGSQWNCICFSYSAEHSFWTYSFLIKSKGITVTPKQAYSMVVAHICQMV